MPQIPPFDTYLLNNNTTGNRKALQQLGNL